MSELRVATPAGFAGLLSKNGQHSFTYDPSAVGEGNRAREISLTMPLRAPSYTRTPMLSVFQTFLPEGYLRERITERFGKIMRIDDMALLALTNDNAIGRLRLTRPGESRGPTPAESLGELLADQGSRDLFEYLCDKYLISSGVGGVQPKVLVAATDEKEASDRPATPRKISIGEPATLRARQYLVKVGGGEYPDLAENEYHCLRVARALGLDLPEFQLSSDRKRLVIERFDFDPRQESYLGFEDMVSLQGKTNEDKYGGSYESVAKAIAMNASDVHLASSLQSYFTSVVLSMALRNGDAHLKNFGLLYTDPGTPDCRLSPVYDIVCTTVHIPGDVPALSIGHRKDWPDRATLADFGREHCLVDRPEPVIDAALDAIASYRPDDDSSGMWRKIAERADKACFMLAQPRGAPRPRSGRAGTVK